MSQLESRLGSENTEKLRRYVFQRESAGAGGYQAENRFGFVGGYQFGAAALEDVGLVRPGVGKLGNAALNNAANWNDPPGSKQGFLSNPAIQDRAFLNLADRNLRTLSSAGVINANTPPEQVAGYVAASHLVGAGSVIRNPNLSATDANGTSARSYYQGAAGVISGRTEVPPATTEGRRGALRQNSPNTLPFTGQGISLASSDLPGEIIVSTFSSTQQFIPLPQPNPLSVFSSFSVIFTLSNLSVQQCNFPETSYKRGNIGRIIARQGGAGGTTPGLATGDQYDFFLDEFEFDMLMTFNRQTKGTNATTFNFTVTEPYSMGLFFQALNVAATENRHPHYLASPFLLTMEFIGYLEDGTPKKLEDHTRHLPIRLTNVQMNVSGGGAKYNVSALAWNEQAYFDEFNRFKTDIAIAGSSVLELLQTGEQSLQTVLNKRLQELAAKESAAKVPDEVVIIFPKEIVEREAADDSAAENDSTATQDPAAPASTNAVDGKLTLTRGQGNIRTQNVESVNAIGASTMDFNMTMAGASASVRDDEAQSDPDKGITRNRVIYDVKSRQYLFEQGTSIVNAISSVVTMSKYCKDAVDPNNPKIENGMVPWFRIESEVYIQPPKAGNNAAGRYPLLIVYKVVPYLVQHAKITAPNSGIKDKEALMAEVAKVYDYIYTGKNTEVLRFDLEFKTAVFTPATADQGKTNFLAAYARQFGIDDSSTAQTTTNLTGSEQEPLAGSEVQGQELEQNPDVNGSEAVDYKTLIAQAFNKALYDGQVDLINAEMEIMGDPYFIADSGLGNFSNSGSGTFNMTSNYAMDYQSGEVHILVNFRTPLDYGENGIMNFGPTEVVEAFSGLYRVNFVTNRVNRGKFTQTLRLLRVPNQSTTTAESPAPVDIVVPETNTVSEIDPEGRGRGTNRADVEDVDKPTSATVNTQNNRRSLGRTPPGIPRKQQSVTPVPATIDATPEYQINPWGGA